MERLHHLRIKTAPSHQDARPRGVTRHAGRPRMKKEAAKKSLGRKKTLLRSQHRSTKTVRHLLRWRVDIKTRLCLRDGLR